MFFLLFFFVELLTLKTSFACPLTDEFLTRCHCGILTNGESYIQCDEYSLNDVPIFKRSFPYDELRLRKNFIRILTSTAFENIKTIKRIDFEENPLEKIDSNVFRSLGNYLEELTLSADGKIRSLEFLTRFPLKKLRVLKLDRFDLSDVDLKKIFVNMTKLENLTLKSCQITEIPQLERLKTIEIENNPLSSTIFLSTNYSKISLISNRISSIILQKNVNLTFLNLSMNELKEFYSIVKLNPKLNVLDLSQNQLTNVDSTIFSENLNYLNLSRNNLTKISLNFVVPTLKTFDLSSNRIRTIERSSNIRQFENFDLSSNPLDCHCQLKWLKDVRFNTTNWICAKPFYSSFQSAEFKCQSFSIGRLVNLNVTLVEMTTEFVIFLLQWKLVDPHQTIRYLQISVESPFRLSKEFSPNRTFFLVKENFRRNFHFCLIFLQQFSRDRYCRDFVVDRRLITKTNFNLNSLENDDFLSLIDDEENSMSFELTENHFRLMLIGSCLGGLITMILLFTCCYLCYQLHRFQRIQTSKRFYVEKISPRRIYHSENLSTNSTDTTQIDSLLSTNPHKHIYQTIDNHDYSTLTRPDKHLFDLWNESIREQY